MTDAETASNMPMQDKPSHHLSTDSTWAFADFLASNPLANATNSINNASDVAKGEDDQVDRDEEGEKTNIFQNIIPYEKKAI